MVVNTNESMFHSNTICLCTLFNHQPTSGDTITPNAVLILFNALIRMVKQPHCIMEERKNSLVPFWEWVEKATYEGDRKIRERVYDFWGYSVS